MSFTGTPENYGQKMRGPAIGAHRAPVTGAMRRLLSPAFGGFMALLAMLVAFCVPAGATAPLAGTNIDNTALLSYTNLPTAATSNSVRVTVQGIESFTLVDNHQLTALSGAQVTLYHTLTNTGNVPSIFTLTLANLTGDGFDINGLTLYRNSGNTGTLASTDPIIPPGGTITLNPGEHAILVITGVMPASAPAGTTASTRIAATTSQQGVNAANTDAILCQSPAQLQLVKSASSTTPQPGDQVIFTVSGSNSGGSKATGTGTTDGNTLLVDGNPAQLVLVRDIVPANTSYVTGSLNCAIGATRLYHRSGDPPFAYLQGEPSLVDETACGVPSLDISQIISLSFAVRINQNASGKIDNTARVFYLDGTGYQLSSAQPRTADSNTIELTLPDRPATINFYTDTTFSRVATAAPLGNPLFIQVNAPQCNTNPLVAESKIVTITSTLTGDVETLSAVETGPNTGIYRIVPDVPTRDGIANPVVHGNGTVEERKNDQLTASIEGCGTASASADLYVDPRGIVFNSRTNAPLAGIQVTLVDVTGAGNGGNAGGPAKVFSFDGITPVPATQTTGADGTFQFPLVAASSYQLKAAVTTGYRFPSTLPTVLLPTNRDIDPSGSYGGTFIVNSTIGVARVDLPVDPIPASGFFVEKSASVTTAEPGDFADYTVKIKNGTGKPLAQTTLNDTLPFGFSYQPGSARLNGAATTDPAGGRGPRLAFQIGSLADGDLATLTYRVKIGPASLSGDGINYAQASDPSGATSNVASARINVQGGVFSDKGFLIGKVFVDCNRNRVQDQEELGIPGVRLYLEDGTFVITDSEGKYSLYNISSRTHVLKIDNTTVPAGAELIELSNRNAGDAGSLFIDMKSGELHKANFAEGSCNAEVLKEVKARRAKGEVTGAESDRTLIKPLTFVAVTAAQNDVRGLPASGLVGGTTISSAVSPAPAEKSLPQPQTAPGRSAQPPPSPELEDYLAGADKSIAFLNLKDGSVLPIAQTPIRIKGPAGGSLKLLVNGLEVPDRQMGKKIVDSERQIESREYIAVDLKPGVNTLQTVLFDPFGNRRGERTIHVTAPGKLSKITISIPEREFAADDKTPLPVTVRLIDENGIPVKMKTTLTIESSLGKWEAADLDEKEPGTQVMVEGGSGEYLLRPPAEPGEALIKISTGTVKAEQKVYFYPDLRPMIAAGLVEGTINLRNLGRSALVPSRAQDGFEQEIRTYGFSGDNGKQEGGGRAALFLKGKVKGDYLLTLSYDSDKDTRDALFRDIQPDQFYPVYGDSSVKGFDAQSTGKLYVRIDKNKSYLLYGDYITSAGGDARLLGAYNRSLNGFKGHFENSYVSANTFATRDTSNQIIDELPAQGLSGPYFITKSGFIANSEKVEIITRDRNQPSLVLKSVPQTRFTDYEIEELSGRILFKAPVPTLDLNMNPNYIRVTYETDQGGDKFWVAGVDAQAKIHKRLEVGASYVRDENPLDKADLKSANATIKLFDKTYLIGEWAEAFKESIGRGDAERFELRHEGEKLQARVYGVRTDAGFANPSSTYGQGRKEAGAKLTYKATQTTTITGEAIHSEDTVTGGKKDGILANIQHSFGANLQGEFGARYAHEMTAPSQPGGVAPNDVTSLRIKLTGKIPQLPKLSLTGEYEQSINHGDRRLAAGGAEYQLSAVGKLYARHEFIDSLAGPYNLNGSQQQNATLAGIDTEYMKEGKVFSEYRVRDAIAGRDAEAAIGLRNGWNIAKGIKLSTTLERIQKLDGTTDNTATAVTGALEYTASPLWKGTARIEVRSGTTSNTLLNTLGAAYKMNRNITLLGRQFLSYTDNKGTSGDLVQERLQAGFAYRPTDTDTWNVLARYEFKYEDNGGAAALATDRAVHIVSTHLNYQPEKALTMSARYAGKLVFENSNGLASRSNTHLLSGRTIYDLTSRWDVGLNYSALFSDLFKSCRYGAGGEVGYLVAANLWVSTGYNIYGFRDKDLSAEEYTAQGVYFRLRFKFDEDLFAGNNPKANKTLAVREIAKADR